MPNSLIDKVFDEVAEKEFGAEVDKEIQQAQNKKAKSIKESKRNNRLKKHTYLEEMTLNNEAFICREYYKYMGLKNSDIVTEENLCEGIVKRIANENCYPVDKIKKLLLNKKEK